ncbi:CAP domain-containing protein [Alteribacillus sp. YIM 98480]|uniref:CAP domain-containing protein n=1 Tax=Alteribacillus sp. YIM 98480 TaxID=2606599 RepID=UPI00131A6286|nr:CAP domain-containing protein [Alteribacillus sp. YIM 98480]
MKKIVLSLAVLIAFPAAVNAQESQPVDSGELFSKLAEQSNLTEYELFQATPELEELDVYNTIEQYTTPGEVTEQPNEDQAAEEEETTPASEQEAEEETTPAAEEQVPAAEQQAPATGDTAAEQNTGNDEEVASESEFEQEVIRLTNEEREKQGLQPLEPYSELSDVARDKSEDMRDAGYFSHNSPNYGSPFDMMDTYGIEYQGAGENIAAGQQSPEQVVEGWMNSEGHRENILNGSFTHIGVGHAEGGSYGNYWTQMFVTK